MEASLCGTYCPGGREETKGEGAAKHTSELAWHIRGSAVFFFPKENKSRTEEDRSFLQH